MIAQKHFLSYLLTLTIFLLGGTLFAQKASSVADLHQRMQAQTDEIYSSLVELRHDFHRHPEVSEQEKNTSEKVVAYLRTLGLEVKTNVGGYGVVGILKGAKKGKKIAWRADMDAMPSDIPDVVDFASEVEGVRHICGHDVHTTIGLGIANVLASQKAHLKGTVYFIFQPSEENFKGAQAMIDDGLFDLISPREIYGLHMSPMPQGLIGTKSEAVFAYLNQIDLVFDMPQNKDGLVAECTALLQSFQTVDPESKFWDPRSLMDLEIGLSSPQTIFGKYLTLLQEIKVREENGQLRISSLVNSSDQAQLDALKKGMRRKIRKTAYKKDLVEVRYSYAKAALFNDAKLTQASMNTIAEVYGPQSTAPLHGVTPGYYGDDFAYFQDKVPGVYFFLGGSNFEKGIISMPHTPNFAVDEACIKTGVNYFSSLLAERLLR